MFVNTQYYMSIQNLKSTPSTSLQYASIFSLGSSCVGIPYNYYKAGALTNLLGTLLTSIFLAFDWTRATYDVPF